MYAPLGRARILAGAIITTLFLVHGPDAGHADCTPPGAATADVHTCTSVGGDPVNFNAGGSDDTIDVDSGTISGTLGGGNGNDTINHNDGTTNTITGNGGHDVVNVFGGTITQINGATGNDTFNVMGGIVGGLAGNADNDTFNLSGGTINGSINGGGGNDTVNVMGTVNLNNTTEIQGGVGTDDLNFDGWIGSIEDTVIDGWETIDFINGSMIDLGPMTGGIQAPGGTITLDSTSMLWGGGAGITNLLMVNLVAGETVIDGTIDLQQNQIGDLFGITSDISGSGDIMLDVQFDDLIANGGTGGSDVIFASVGAIQAGTDITLHVNPIFGGQGYTTDLIPLVALVNGATSPDDAFSLEGDGLFGNYYYDLVYNDGLGWFALENQGIHPDLAGYAVPISGAQFLWQDSVGTLRERLGGVRVGGGPEMALGGQTASADGGVSLTDAGGRRHGATAPAVWIRGFGGHTEVDDDDGVDFDQKNLGGQIGADIGFEVSGDGDQVRVGLFAGYGGADIDMHHGVGDADIEGFTLGGYATYFSPYGLYIDLVVAGQWLDFDTEIDSTGSSAEYDGGTIGGSFEVGYQAMVDDFFVEPQAQITYVNVSHDDFTDSLGSSIDDGESDSLRGRFSVRGGPVIELDGGGRVLPYVEAGVIHEFAGENKVRVDSNSFESDIGGTIFEIGGGVMADLGENVSLNADVDFGFGNTVDSIQGVLGLRVAF